MHQVIDRRADSREYFVSTGCQGRACGVTVAISVIDSMFKSRGGGELPYESEGDARRKIRIKPLKETIWAWLRRYLTPKGDHA